MKTYLFRVWLWCAISLIALVGLRYLPEGMTFQGYDFRPVDVLAEVTLPEPKGPEILVAEQLENNAFSQDFFAANAEQDFQGGDVAVGDPDAAGIAGDSSQTGHPLAAKDLDALGRIFRPGGSGSGPRSADGLKLPKYTIPIEDFGREQSAMRAFYQSLKSIRHQGKSVHVAFFGDSFIEGDLVTDRLRDTLQRVFGGRGIGYVPVASSSNLSKTTIIQNASGFTHRSAVDTGRTGRIFSISGYMATPTEESNQVTYHGIRNSKNLQWFDQVTLLYRSPRAAQLHYKSGAQSGRITLNGGQGLQAYRFSLDSARNVNFSFPKDSTLQLHGLSFESGPGIYIDNFGLRGNSGHAFFRTSPALVQASDSLLNYRLIIVQYGLNVLSRGQTDYAYYGRTLKQVIEYLQQNFSQSSILIIGVGDRSERKDGEFVSMEGIDPLIQIQRRVARDCGVAFWDLYEAMGGPGSMVRFVDHQPALANKDYTHINRRGGNILADQLAKALLNGYAKSQE